MKSILNKLLKDEKGEINIIAIILIIIVVIALVAIFKTQLTGLVNSLFNRLQSDVDAI